MFVTEVQLLQPPARSEVSFTLVHVFERVLFALGTAPVTNAMWCYPGLCSAVLYYMLRDVQRFMDDNSGFSPCLQLAHSASPPTP